MQDEFAHTASVQRWIIIYHGRVQGVGFRQTTARIARRHPVTGFVRNRPDGTVELVVECAREMLDAFQADIAAVFRRNIDRFDLSVQPATGEFARFEVRS